MSTRCSSILLLSNTRPFIVIRKDKGNISKKKRRRKKTSKTCCTIRYDILISSLKSLPFFFEGVDGSFLEKITGIHRSHNHFRSLGSAFEVKHYAGDVVYEVQGFCNANRLKQATRIPLHFALLKKKLLFKVHSRVENHEIICLKKEGQFLEFFFPCLTFSFYIY